MPRASSDEPTSQDVARLAGVSRQTVNRALGGYGYVGEEAMQKVRAAATELGYRPNAAARALLTGRSRTIGIVCVDIANPFFAEVVSVVCAVAMERGYDPLIATSRGELAAESASVEALLGKRVEGLIVAPTDVQHTEHLREAVDAGTPVVLLDRVPAQDWGDSVGIDNVQAGADVARALLERGHVRIGVVVHLQGAELGWPAWDVADDAFAGTLNPSAARLLGHLRALRAAGVTVDPALVVAVETQDAATGARAAEALMAAAEPPTAVFGTDNVLSSGLYGHLLASGRSVPDEVSVFVFDDLDWTRLTTPGLSVVAQPFASMGEDAARLLFDRIDGPDGAPARRVVAPYRLLHRGSVATRPID